MRHLCQIITFILHIICDLLHSVSALEKQAADFFFGKEWYGDGRTKITSWWCWWWYITNTKKILETTLFLITEGGFPLVLF